MKFIVVGIDPGLNGGIAILNQQGKVLELEDMPTTIESKYNFFKQLKENYVNRDIFTMVEKVASRPTDSRRGAFTFGREVGELTTILWILGYSVIYVRPVDWLKTFNLKRDKGETKYFWKKRLRDYARSILERVGQSRKGIKRLTLNTCDAYLIALHYYYQLRGKNA